MGWAAIYCTFVFAAGVLLMPTGAFWLPDHGAKFLELLHLSFSGAHLDARLDYPAAILDPAHRLFQFWSVGTEPDGQLRSWYPLSFPLLSWAPFQLFGLRGLLILPALGGLACAWLCSLIAEQSRPGRGWVAFTITALATPVFFYSQLFWEHTPALALCLGGILLVQRQSLFAKVGGLLLAASAGLLRPELLVVAGCCLVWVTFVSVDESRRHRWTKIGLFLCGTVGGASVAWFSSYRPALTAAATITGGQLWRELTSAGFFRVGADLWERLGALLYNSSGSRAVVWAPGAAVTIAAVILAVAAGLVRTPWHGRLLLAATACLLPVSLTSAIAGEPPGAVHGLVLGGPMLLVSIAAIARWRSFPKTGLTAAAMVTSFVFLIAFLAFGTAGGREWGPRGALVIYALAAVVAAVSIEIPRDWWKSPSTAATAMLLALSLLTQVRGLSVVRADLAVFSGWTNVLSNMPSQTMMTDMWWLMPTIAPAYEHQRFVYFDPDANSADSLAYLRSQPAFATEPAAWVTACPDRCSLPDWLSASFVIVREDRVPGLWVAQLQARKD